MLSAERLSPQLGMLAGSLPTEWLRFPPAKTRRTGAAKLLEVTFLHSI